MATRTSPVGARMRGPGRANGVSVMSATRGSWLDAWTALCVTVTRSLGPDEVARAMAVAEFQAFPEMGSAQDWHDSGDTGDRACFATGWVGDWTFV